MDLTKLPAKPSLAMYDGRDPEAVAAEHGFVNWEQFQRHVAELNDEESAVAQFERASDAVVDGDRETLARLLASSPELVRGRSGRVHVATLLHYVGANGVENWRQKSPANAVEIAKLLLEAGAEVDAPAGADGKGTALGLVATSVHPAKAGVQLELLRTLLDAGASVDGVPGGWNPLIAALHNGRQSAAEYLAERGARLDLEGAAGVGDAVLVERLFEEEGAAKGPAGMMWACQYGRPEVVEVLLRRGIPANTQVHGATGLHWAAFGGHAEIVRLLLQHGAPVNGKDERFGATTLGWALHGWAYPRGEGRAGDSYAVARQLVAAGATLTDPSCWENTVREDPRMREALGW